MPAGDLIRISRGVDAATGDRVNFVPQVVLEPGTGIYDSDIDELSDLRFRCYGGAVISTVHLTLNLLNSKQPPHQQVIITISRLVSVAELSVYNYSGTILAQTLAITSAAVDARAPSLLISLFGGGVAGYMLLRQGSPAHVFKFQVTTADGNVGGSEIVQGLNILEMSLSAAPTSSVPFSLYVPYYDRSESTVPQIETGGDHIRKNDFALFLDGDIEASRIRAPVF